MTFLRSCFLYVHIKTGSRFARSHRFLMGSPLWFLYRPHCYAKFVAKTAAVEAPSGHCFLCMCSTCNLLFSLESAGPTNICLLSIWQHCKCTKVRLDRIESSDESWIIIVWHGKSLVNRFQTTGKAGTKNMPYLDNSESKLDEIHPCI